MNDPLRDNRIFPEEMQEQKIDKPPINLSWLWTLLIILAVLTLVFVGYQYYQNNLRTTPVTFEEGVFPTLEGQQTALDSLQQASPEMDRAERQEKITTLFGN
jgi:hypothetical protein